jgi:GNAT superfamily N-acetyltransferase
MNRKARIPEPDSDTPVVRDDFTRLPAGKLAAVVTHLEMRARPQLRPEPAGNDLSLVRTDRPDLDWYRDLYRRVGQEWLWFSRVVMADGALAGIIHHPKVEVYALRDASRDAGILELDFRRAPDAEISFLGLERHLIGTGAGRFLMNRALELAWSRRPRRLTVHTCTLDHPNALGFYLRSGFVPYARSLEIADDPRLAGILPRDAAPHVPIVERD